MHLSETYGDRAFSVVRGASITGKRWPIVGKRLHDEYPYIEAEVREVLLRTKTSNRRILCSSLGAMYI